MQEKIVPPRKLSDGVHVAIATFQEAEFVVSWNYKHMVNARKVEQYHTVNLLQGFAHSPKIVTPQEAFHAQGENP